MKNPLLSCCARALAVAFALLLLPALAGCRDQTLPTWEPAPVQRSPGAPLGERDLVQPKRLSGTCSAVGVGAFVELPFGALLAVAVALAWVHRRRARAEAALDPRAPLADGPAVVFGVVEAEQHESDPVVVVRIHQQGTQWQHKGSWHHAWKETGRDVRTRPFHVVREDGVRVRVEPEADVVLHESLLYTEQQRLLYGVRTDARDRVAEIRPGEQVHVSAELVNAGRAQAGAYRGSGAEPVLRPPRVGPMIISSELPGDTERRRMRFHAAATAAIAAAIVAACAVGKDYLALTVDGLTVMAAPTGVRTWQTWEKPKNSRGYWVSHYGVTGHATLADGREVYVEDECAMPVYACVRGGGCPAVPFVVAPRLGGVSQVGEHATISIARFTCLLLLVNALGWGYLAWGLKTRPWYMRRKVNDGGTGPLTAPDA